MRILNLEPQRYADEARVILRSIGEIVEGPFRRAELLQIIPSVDILIVRLGHRIDRELIDAGRRLTTIVSATTGLDHIDLERARERSIAVLSLRGETEFLRTVHATSEHTIALILAALRRIPAAFASVCAGEWDRDRFRGHELDRRRLGLVGCGRIGRIVATIAQAFGAEVSAFDPSVAEFPPGVRRAQSLRELLARTDILSLHVPLDDGTRQLVGDAELAALPRGAGLVNTSRGEIVDERAVVGALEREHLAWAAVDVVSNERDDDARRASPLLAYARRHDNLLLTPHIGGATHESMTRTEVFMARKLLAHHQGHLHA